MKIVFLFAYVGQRIMSLSIIISELWSDKVKHVTGKISLKKPLERQNGVFSSDDHGSKAAP